MTSISLMRKLRFRKLNDLVKVTQQLRDRNTLDAVTLNSADGVAE